MSVDVLQSEALAQMKPISLEEMDSVKLMNRIDTKFMTTESILLEILKKALAENYYACMIEGLKVTPYESMYYDTSDLEMFRIHRSGRLVRQKIRVRTYTVSGTSFLEIKRKNNKGRTKKSRMFLPSEYKETLKSCKEAQDYVRAKSRYDLDSVEPACMTNFKRITLVNFDKTERITFDTCLNFKNPRTGKEVDLGDAVIIEVKQDGRVPSKMARILLDLRVHVLRVSKYCIGTVLTDSNARPGRFKEKIRSIEKTTKHTIY